MIYILFRWNETLGIRAIEAAEQCLREIDESLKGLEKFKRKHAEIILFQLKEEKFSLRNLSVIFLFLYRIL